MSMSIDTDNCDVCCDCINCCPTDSYGIRCGKIVHHEENCEMCGQCVDFCRNDVIKVD